MIVEKWLSGNVPTEIGKELRLSRQTISNIVDNYICKGVHAAGKGGNRTCLGRTDNVINYVKYRKTIKPSSFGAKIQNTLVVCLPENVPSLASISRILRDNLGYSHKKLSVISRESQTPQAEEKLTQYLTSVANMDTKTMHFFDECLVVKTTGNWHYGHASVGKPAMEVQRYASNATYTVNLLHNTYATYLHIGKFCPQTSHWVVLLTPVLHTARSHAMFILIHGHVNVLHGPSNGLELLNFLRRR